MASEVNSNKKKIIDQFVDVDDQDIEKLLEESKAKNTNRSTNTSLTKLRAFLAHRDLPALELITNDELPDILTKFYTSARTQKKGELYQTSSFKVIRSGLNRYFKRERSIDIVSDEKFVRANLVFDGVQVKAKKCGKGATKSTAHISDEDMTKLSNYFHHDHVKFPSPKILQQCVQFYIMFFFCRRG